ncbi:DUF1836 domain-containing protein [Clostridium kluyveri]|uniref:DUF1836 domain-containing protein n=2 Tax=Clostridium kluyveri TaxID=1534 RepID=A5N5B7_CLOK5|nr:DUF1836 domain-containing protein [Clostridium kluyveri]EDK32498.1 Conserved hypothetical protein [Clostridium kluyveri DSM 555]BAH05440.1 hypothetical protein CKR_0389 [Clostridium kluyveri NBRC 12016]
MYKDELEKLIQEFGNFTQLKLENIPDIDLYMDQVTTLIEEKLGHLKRTEGESTLTKTMINNYTKSGILMPPKKKKYSKQHIILIVLTYYLKQILSIGDIQKLFSPIVTSIIKGEDRREELNSVYKSFLEIEKSEIESFIKNFEHKIGLENILKIEGNDEKTVFEDKFQLEGEKDIVDLILVVIMLIVKANMEKRMAEKIIDKFFTK